MVEAQSEVVLLVKPERAIDVHHPGFQGIKNRVEVADMALTGLFDGTKRYLNETVKSVFPERKPPKDLPTGEPPHYRAAILTPKPNGENPLTPKKLAIVMLAGISNTGPSQAHVAAEVFAHAETSLGKDAIGMVASIGSFVSLEAASDRYVSDIVTRAAYQAAYIFDMLRQHPAEELIIAGRSMGGAEAAYVYPILKKLLEDNEVETKISGLIVIQAGGQFHQSRWEFLKKIGNLPRGTATEAFPSLVDIYHTQTALDEAKEAFDTGKVRRLQDQIREMQQRYLNPPIADEAVLVRVKAIDEEIAKAWGNDGKKVHHLSEERFRLVNRVLSKAVKGADVSQHESPRGKREKIKAKLPWAVVGARVLRAIFADNTKNVMEPLPDWLRDKIDCPVAVVWGNEDAVFSSRQALARMFDEQLSENRMRGQRGAYFGRSKVRFMATIGNWGHASSLVNPKKFARIFTDIINRMRSTTHQRGINDPPVDEILHY